MQDSDETDRAAKAREITAAYNRMWEAKNRDHRKAYHKAYYAENRETLLEKRRAYIKAWHEAHPEARKEHKQRYREKNREKLREDHRKYVQGESGNYQQVAARKAIKRAMDLEAMAGRPRPEVCDACGGPPDPKKGLHYDHCHKHGHFRGWLCRECNLALGNIRDSPDRLRKLIAYLERAQVASP